MAPFLSKNSAFIVLSLSKPIVTLEDPHWFDLLLFHVRGERVSVVFWLHPSSIWFYGCCSGGRWIDRSLAHNFVQWRHIRVIQWCHHRCSYWRVTDRWSLPGD